MPLYPICLPLARPTTRSSVAAAGTHQPCRFRNACHAPIPRNCDHPPEDPPHTPAASRPQDAPPPRTAVPTAYRALIAATTILLLLVAALHAKAVPPPNCVDTTYGTAQTVTINPADTNFVLDLARCTYSAGLTITATSATPLTGVTIAVREGAYSSVTVASLLVLGAGSSFVFANASVSPGAFALSASARDGGSVRLEGVAQIAGGLSITGSYQSTARLALLRVTVDTTTTTALDFAPSTFTMTYTRVEDSTFRTTSTSMIATGVDWDIPTTTHVVVEFVNNLIEGTRGFYTSGTSATLSTNATLWMRGNTFKGLNAAHYAFRLYVSEGRLDHDGSNRHVLGVVYVGALASSTGNVFVLNGSSVSGAIWARSGSTIGTNETVHIVKTTVVGAVSLTPRMAAGTILLECVTATGAVSVDGSTPGLVDSRVEVTDLNALEMATAQIFTRTSILLSGGVITTVTLAGTFTDLPLSLTGVTAPSNIAVSAAQSGVVASLTDVATPAISWVSATSGGQVLMRNVTAVTGTVHPLAFAPTSFTMTYMRVEDSTFRTTSTSVLATGVYWNIPTTTHVVVEFVNTLVEGTKGFYAPATSATLSTNATLWMRRNIFKSRTSADHTFRLYLGAGRLDHDGSNRHEPGDVHVSALVPSTGNVFVLNGSSVASVTWTRSGSAGTNETIHIVDTAVAGAVSLTPRMASGTILLERVTATGAVSVDGSTPGLVDSRVEVTDLKALSFTTAQIFTRTSILLSGGVITTVTLAGTFTDLPLSLTGVRVFSNIALQGVQNGVCASIDHTIAQAVAWRSATTGGHVLIRNVTTVTAAVYALEIAPTTFTMTYLRVEDSTFRSSAGSGSAAVCIGTSPPRRTRWWSL